MCIHCNQPQSYCHDWLLVWYLTDHTVEVILCSEYNTRLYCYYYTCPSTGAHRALPDVIAMEKVFSHLSLVGCLSKLHIRTPQQQSRLWNQQKRLYQRTTSLTKSLGGKPSITSAQAKRLDVLGFSYEELLKLRADCKDTASFLVVLKDRGVKSKPLREKLGKLLKK